MELFFGENRLLTSDTGEFVLTDRRVRQTVHTRSQSQLTSIALAEVVSVSIARRSKPVFLYLGIIVGLIGLVVFSGSTSDGAGSFLIFVGLILLLVYATSRYQALVVSSPADVIALDVRGMSFEKAIELVDRIEAAKLALAPGRQGV